MSDLATKIESLSSALDELEDVLYPVLDTPLSNLLSDLSGSLDRAKLQVWLSYVLGDLVWIYLRSKGVNPSNVGGETHEVVAELDRVKQYFAKLKNAEDPAKRSLVVDNKAADRFIKNALASALAQPAPTASTHIRFDEDGNAGRPAPKPAAQPESNSSDEEPEVGTWKAKKRAREADLAKQQSDEESDESLDGWEESAADANNRSKGTKRPRMDPFAGYDQPGSRSNQPEASTSQATSTDGMKKRGKRTGRNRKPGKQIYEQLLQK